MILLAPLLLAAPALLAQEPSAKDLFDQQLGQLRGAQAPDGSYGGRLDTARMVVAYALSPRAYREYDGPFVGDAVRWLLAFEPPFEDPEGDVLSAFALQTVNAARYAGKIQALAERHGVPAGTVAALAQRGDLGIEVDAAAREPGAWAAGLPLPEPGADAVSVLLGIDERSGLTQRTRALALAGVLLQRERSSAAPAVDVDAVYARGAEALLRARGESGFWEIYGRPDAGISALAARALLGSPRAEHRAAAVPVLDFLRSLQREDGSIYQQGLPVYVTSVAVMALAAGRRAEDADAIAKAADYLRAVQADEGEGYSEADKFYGGIGYGSDLRPDLSNLQYALQALHDAKAGSDDPAYSRALVFLQRTQNRSESNPEVFEDGGRTTPVRSGNDGGAVYYPGNSPAGYVPMPDGSVVARSYGSMTYALLKCYVFAGLPAEDERVQAAVRWIGSHWTLEVNPGFDTLRDPRAAYQGLYYYYLSVAEALSSSGIDRIETADGAAHDWRAELRAHLAGLQREDGTWVNEQAERWWEGNPVLCTAYTLSALAAARTP